MVQLPGSGAALWTSGCVVPLCNVETNRPIASNWLISKGCDPGGPEPRKMTSTPNSNDEGLFTRASAEYSPDDPGGLLGWKVMTSKLCPEVGFERAPKRAGSNWISSSWFV